MVLEHELQTSASLSVQMTTSSVCTFDLKFIKQTSIARDSSEIKCAQYSKKVCSKTQILFYKAASCHCMT